MPSSGDPLFQLECVLLFALDVVKGPYIHSCAPANPSELIRSFLQPPAAAAAAGSSSPPTSHVISSRPPGSPLRRFDVGAEESGQRLAGLSGGGGARRTSGGGSGVNNPFSSHSLPQSGNALLNTSPLLGACGPAMSSSSPLAYGNPLPASAGCPSPTIPGQATPFTGPSSLATVARSGSSITATAIPNTLAASAAAAAERANASSFTAQRRLLGLVDAATPDEARGIAMGTSAFNNASVSEENTTVFAVSPQTNLSESQQTLPSVSPMAGSFAGVTNASMTSNTGGVGHGDAGVGSNSASAAATAALRCGTPGPGMGDGGGGDASAAASWMARFPGSDDEAGISGGGGGLVGHALPPARASLVSATVLSPPLADAAVADAAGRSVPSALTGSFALDSSTTAAAAASSPLASSLHTPPITATLTAPGAAAETRQHQLRSHYGTAGGSRSGYAAAATAGAAATNAAAGATEDGKINSYNDVFVPRSEFCRRVLWLYPAESGLLFLYYAEDIPGEHYQRKTLRYSLCLVFCVDEKRMTIGAGLLHQLVRPYSVVLTNIAEELREAEVKYGYMSRGLQAVATPRRPPPPPPPPLPQQQQQQQQQTDLSSFSSAISAATQPMTATSTVVVDISAAVTRETSETAEDEEDGAEPKTDSTPTSTAVAAAASSASSAQQRSFRMGRRRVLNESSARPDTYHLALVERSTPAPLVTTATAASADADTTTAAAAAAAVSELSDQTPTSYMSPLPPNTSGSDASAGTGRGEAAAAPAEGDAIAKQSTVEGKTKNSESATATATTATVTEGTSGSPSYVATSRTTTGTTPSSQFGTPFSPLAPEGGATTRGGSGGAGPRLPSGSGGDGNTERTVAAAPAAAGGAAESSSASAVSPSLTDAEAVTVTPPSSLPMRSRTVSQGTGGFLMSSPAFGDSLSTTATATTAPSPLSCLVGPNGPGGVAGPFPSAAGLHVTKCPTHPAATASAPHHHHYSSSSPTGTHRGAGTVEGSYAHVTHAVHTLNAFITPTTAPQWTPLSELVEELYRCLRYGGSGEDDGDGSAVTTGASTSAAAAAAVAATAAVSSPGSLSGRLSGGSLSTSAVLRPQQSANGVAAARHGAASRWPSVPSPLGRAQPQPPMQQQQQQQAQQRARTRQLYSPLTTRLPGGGRESLWVLGGGAEEGGEVAQAEGRAEACSVGAAAVHFPRTPIAMAPPQRGDVSVVHLSDRLSFHVRRMAPLQAARMIDFAHVPVPIVPYDPTMVEWMDMAVHHVFRLVDGVRTVADLVFGVAMGTTTTLAEVYADALRRSKQLAQAAAVAGQAATLDASEERQGAETVVTGSAGSRDKASSRGSSVGGRAGAKRVAPQPASRAAAAATATEEQRTTPKSALAPQHRPRAMAVPIDARPSLTFLPGVRYSMPTSAAAAAAAAAISDGQAQLPSHVNVRVAPTTPEPASDAAATAGSASLSVPAAAGTLSAMGKGGGATTSPSPPPPSISVELPTTWVATTGIVVEALLHLELCHLLKIYRPWTGSTLYSATLALQRLLRNGRHPARQVLAQHLLHVAWVERQQMRRERQAQRKAAAEALKSQKAEQRQPQQPQAEGEGSGGIMLPLQGSAAEAPPMAPLSTPGPAALGPSLPSPSLSPALSSKGGVLHGAAASASSTGKAPAAVSQFPSDRVSWLPAAVTVHAPSSSSSAPRPGSYSDAHAGPVQPRQVPHAHPYQTSPSVLSSGASSLRRPPPTGSGSGGGGVESGSNANTHASSMSTSYALSCSLKHSVSVGVTGKLQMNLMSSLPTSPMLRPSAANMGGVNNGAVAAQRLPGSHTAARGLVDGLPSPADPNYGASLSLPPGRHLHHHHGGGGVPSTSSETTSSTSSSSSSSSRSSSGGSASSSSEVGGDEQARPAAVAATPGAGQRPSPPSSTRSRSATSERNASRQASSPVSFQPTSSLHDSRRPSHHARRSGSAHSSASTTLTSSSSSASSAANRRTDSTDLLPHSLPTLLVTSALSPPETTHVNAALRATAAAAAAAVSTSSKLVSSSVLSGQEAQESSPAAASALRETGPQLERGAAGIVRGEDTAAASASASDPPSRAGRVKLGPTFSAGRPQTDPTSAGPDSSSEVRKRRTPKPLRRDAALRVFVPSDAELAQAAAAALCALAKFGNTTVSSVQAEMRRMPVWAPSFNHWSDRCVHAMVEVAVLNNWLEDVSP